MYINQWQLLLHVQSTHCTHLHTSHPFEWNLVAKEIHLSYQHYPCISSYNPQIIKNTYLNKNFAILWIPECENLNICLEFRSVKSSQIQSSVYSAWTSWIVFYVSLVPKTQQLHQRSIVLMLVWFGYECWLTGGFCKCSTALRAHFQELQGPPSWEQWVNIIWIVPGTQHSLGLFFFWTIHLKSNYFFLTSAVALISDYCFYLQPLLTGYYKKKKSFPVLFQFFHIDGKFPGGFYSKFLGVFIFKFWNF